MPDDAGLLSRVTSKLSSGVALRRATRVAVVVPPTLLLFLSVPYTSGSALFGVFGALALLLFADFGGPMRDRAIAYAATTAAGIPLLLIGITWGQRPFFGALIMFLVAMIVGLAGVLRGMFASAQTVLLLVTVLAVTSAAPGSQLPALTTWTIGGLIALVAALVLWPARPSRSLLQQLSVLYAQVATTVRTRWAEPDRAAYDEALAEFDKNLAGLRGSFEGNLMRPAGLTDTDRSIAQLVDLLSRLRGYQKWVDVLPENREQYPELDRANRQFATVVADELDLIASELGHGGRSAVDPNRIRVARDDHLTALTEWVQQHRGHLPGPELRRHLDDLFPLRVASISTELASASAAGNTHFYDSSLDTELAPPRQEPWQRFAQNLSWDSPWFRNALRSAIALSLSVLIAKNLGLQHSFWIVLGTLTALRFDALGTGRTAFQALAGTAAGVGVGAALIMAVGDNQAVWWALLPVVLLVTGYTPGTFSLAVGQAGFSVTVIVLFSLFAPATLETAELRLIDVVIGLAVSLAVSLLMWPRGVVATLRARMTTAMSAATDHLMMSIDYIAGGAVDRELLTMFAHRSALAMDQAAEAYDLSVAQRPPKSVPVGKWYRVAIAARHVDVSANLLPGVAQTVLSRGGTRPIPLSLTGPVLATAHDVRRHLRQVVEAWRSESPSLQTADIDPTPTPTGSLTDAVTSSESVTKLRAAIDAWLEEPSDWTGVGADPTPALVVWTADWNAFISWNAEVLQRTLSGADAPHNAVTAVPPTG